MIEKIELSKFKRFNNISIETHPHTISFIVGGNNSGKSSILHALAVWEFCKTVLIFEKGDSSIRVGYRGAGIGIAFDDFTPINIRKLQRFFAEEGEKCFENKIALPNGVGEISVPTTTFNLVHQMVHIYHHLLIGGVGMRQLMDYYFVLRTSYANDDANDNVLRIISGLGLNRFASALMWVLGEVFGLERSFMLWEPNEEDGRFLLNEVVLSGNFGTYDERLPQHRNKWQSFWMLSVHNLRLFRFTYDDWFWGPLWRIYHFAWRKIKGFE